MKQHKSPPKADYIDEIEGIPFKMIFIEGGQVAIREGDKKQLVTVPDFHLAETPTTQQLWRAIMGADPENLAFKGNQRPVERVSWLDIVEGTPETQDRAFLDVLNKKSAFGQYKLPSEAMWQFAAQGGNKTEGYTYAGSNNLKEVGWYVKNSHQETKPVKQKLANELGLYDMSGNVWEWCADVWTENMEHIPTNGFENTKGDKSRRVLRGGSWYYYGYYSRLAIRVGINSVNRFYYVGFRCARY